MKPRVAIACQGGGSQTAFTAGALQAILDDPGIDSDYELVALSGTSGGAVCCLLTWYGLLTEPAGTARRGGRAADLLARFWEDNSAHAWWDAWFVNPWVVGMHRLQDEGWASPAPLPPAVAERVSVGVKENLRSLIDRQVSFGEVFDLLKRHPDHPTLLVGAVDVLTGQFAVFEETCPDPQWRRQDAHDVPPAVSLDPVLASSSVPPLMRGQVIGDGCYWDGLFSHNPPVRNLVGRDIAMRPDEIWVIQIDPQGARREPTAPAAIVDRRFELSSNLSLNAELHWIKQINQWLDEGVIASPGFKQIKIGRIHMSAELAEGLGLASKVDRSPAYLRNLMADGQDRATEFLHARAAGAEIWEVFPDGHEPRRRGRRPRVTEPSAE